MYFQVETPREATAALYVTSQWHIILSFVADIKETQTGQVDDNDHNPLRINYYVEYWPVGNYNSLLHPTVQAGSDWSLEKLCNVSIDLTDKNLKEMEFK
jgi:hypothetical protein